MNLSSLSIALLGDARSPHITRLAADLCARSHRVSILTREQHPAASLPADVHVISYPGPPSLAARVRAIRRILAALEPDVLHSHFINTGGIPAVASGFHPHVMTVWGSDGFVLPYQSTLARIKAATALRAADWVLSPSEALQDNVRHLSGRIQRNDVLPWGVNTRHFHRRPEADSLRRQLVPHGGPLVLSLRTLSPLYNQDILIDAWKEVLQSHPDATLALSRFAAEPTFESGLQARIAEAGISASIRWLDPVAFEDLPLYYSAADLLVSIPSSDAPALTILESLSCETPVMVSDLPALRHWITPGKEGFFVAPRDAAMVAHEITAFLSTTEDSRRRIGAAGRSLVMARADRERCMDRIIEIYRELAQSRPRLSYLRTAANLVSPPGIDGRQDRKV